jgi:ribosomal protein L6P/L9E
MNLKLPKESIVYTFNQKCNFFLLVISNFQGWLLIRIKSKFILIKDKKLYIYNFLSLIKTYNFFLMNFFLGLLKNYLQYIKLKGMGYKVVKLGLNFIIKLGFSHRILFFCKKNFRYIFLNKQNLKFLSRNLFTIKNIIFKLNNLRKINRYKKKGIFLKGSIVEIKISKKKSKV